MKKQRTRKFFIELISDVNIDGKFSRDMVDTRTRIRCDIKSPANAYFSWRGAEVRAWGAILINFRVSFEESCRCDSSDDWIRDSIWLLFYLDW